MANVQKDLGPVSAYAIAVKHGYQGTEEEWAALQIASAENARAAAESEAAAAQSAKEAAETLASVEETVAQETEKAAQAVKNQETASIESVEAAASAAGEAQEAAIAAKGAETRASIPEDYTALAGKVGQLTEEVVELSDASLVLIKSLFTRQTFDGGLHKFTEVNNRIAYPHAKIYNNDVIARCESGYKFVVIVWSDDSIDPSAFVSSTGWVTDDYTIPANTYFSLTVAKSDDSDITTDDYNKVKLYRTLDKNLEENTTTINADLTKDEAYAALFNTGGEVEPFVFFTDPHYVKVSENGGCRAGYEKHLDIIKAHYDDSSAGFVLCGGDWLNNRNTQANACYELAKIKGKMRALFDKSYLVLGNHDTNYQGRIISGGADSTGQLDQQAIYNLWYGEYGRSYYAFDGHNTKFYVFDSGIDWGHGSGMNDFDKEQVAYLLGELNNNDDAHIALAPHMVYISGETLHPLTDKITEIANVYNNRGKVENNGVTYDFSAKTGKVEFVIAGHTHADLDGVLNGVPYIQTVNADVSASYPTFDLVLVDYGNRVLKTVRIGTGADREINLL